MSVPSGQLLDSLWAITAYFNPRNYRRRLANYHVFRQHLQLPLVTVELSFGGAFDLQAQDADILVQLRGGDVMWQKERLLNIALKSLPTECQKVVWMDCDTIVGSDDWPQRVSRALDDFPIVQPFSQLHHLEPCFTVPDRATPGKITFSQSAFAWARNHGRQGADCFQGTILRDEKTICKGVMWAMRRELLDRHGFFDAGIVGGGDTAMICAAHGILDKVRLHMRMNQRQWEYYLAWARPFFQAVASVVSYVDCPIYHLWHGSMVDRRYRERQEGLQPFDFDPYHDIAIAENGAWRWNSDKPLLHQYVKDYFASRREDG